MNAFDQWNNQADVANYDQLTAQWQQRSAPKKKKGNFFTNLLPSIGGIGGSAAGAAIGSAVLPGVGTLAGALLGGALGGGGGKVAENAAEGNKLSSGVLGEAALNGVLGAGPLRLGKLGIDTVRGVKAGAGLADALKAGGTAARDMSLTRTVGNKLSDSGQKLIAKEFRLNPTQQANFKNLHGEEATSVLRRYGIKKPEDIQAKLEPLQNSFDSVVSTVPNVNKATLDAGLKKVYEPLLKSPALFEQNLGQQVKAQADELLKLAKKGSLPADKVNELRKTFDAAVSYTQKGAPEYNVIKKTADALRGTLQTAADKAGAKTAEGMSFKDVGKELRKLYGLNDVVGKQAYLGTGNLPANIPALLGASAGAGAGGGPLGAIGGIAATKLLNSPVGRRVAANSTIKAGEKLTAKAANVNPFGITNTAKRIAPVGLAGALLDGSNQSAVNQDTTMANATTPNPMTNANITDQSYQNPNGLSSANPYPQENLLADIQRDPANADKYIAYYKSLQEVFAPPTQKLNATQLQQANNAVSGLQDLGTIAQEIQNDPSVLLKDAVPGGSIARRLTGTTGYDAAKQNIVDIIARLRSGAAITQDEANRYMGLLPGVGDTPDTALSKLQRLQGLLSAFANPQAASSGLDASTLAAALGGQ